MVCEIQVLSLGHETKITGGISAPKTDKIQYIDKFKITMSIQNYAVKYHNETSYN